jgi:hypothetical protein
MADFSPDFALSRLKFSMASSLSSDYDVVIVRPGFALRKDFFLSIGTRSPDDGDRG